MKDNDNDHVFEEELATKGHINPNFIKENFLDVSSHPADWFRSFLGKKVYNTCKHGACLKTK